MNNFSLNLKYLRKSKNLTQTEMGSNLDIVSSTYSKYEQGIREPNIDMLVKIADFFNVSVDEIIGREKDIKRNNISNILLKNEIEKAVNELLVEVVAKNREDIIKIIEDKYKL